MMRRIIEWTPTLRLPNSTFAPRPLPASRPAYLRRCTDELYAWQQSSRSAPNANGDLPQTFTLHDGPPYANGPLHIGHALNKITKDLIVRFQVAQGKKVSYIPGWDCHGLPIELKALQMRGEDFTKMDPASVRETAQKLAANTVEEQKKVFKDWAVMGDWDNAYKTMEKGFEIRQLEVFKTMFEKGLIHRQYKPVYWSPSSRTALAEAELEYDENYKSLAAYVRFPVFMSKHLQEGALSSCIDAFSDKFDHWGVVIWTTTPWTLPANRAIAVHNDLEYCVVKDPSRHYEKLIIATSRVKEYEEMIGHEVEVVSTGLRGSDLAGQLGYFNPFQKQNGLQPIFHADFVTDSTGTGLVHLAPGHGMDDYNVCAAHGIEAFAPVNEAGEFTEEAFPDNPKLLEGVSVVDYKRSGSQAVLKYLRKLDMLRANHNYRHKYPIDWRSKDPVIVRATAQWFANVDKIKNGSMKAIEDVKFLPSKSRYRLESFIQGRSQWCISRQRAWGVPIPALYKVLDDGQLEAAMDAETIQHVIDVVKERGIDAWWTDAQDDPAWKPQHLRGSYVRGRDTMDVWFDSGTSWTLLPAKEDQPVADVYLEGTDQHRGWFQSSLLTHVATQSFEGDVVKAPYKTLITHGFTLDHKGRKMSKSLGNVISPDQIMSGELLAQIKSSKQERIYELPAPEPNAMGPDALRLWVASSDYMKDVTIGQPMLKSINNALHKYRVTFKWLLGVLSLPSCPPVYNSFSEIRNELLGQHDLSAPPGPLPHLVDRLAMSRLAKLSHEVHGYYSNYEFFKGINLINNYIVSDLSAFYFEAQKDKIYTGHKADCQDLQKVLGIIFYELLQMLAPVCPLLVEEVWDHLPDALKEGSVHPARAVWTPLPRPNAERQKVLDKANMYITRISGGIKLAQERLRRAKRIGSPLGSAVTLYPTPAGPNNWFNEYFTTAMSTPDPKLTPPQDLSEAQLAELESLFMVSGVEVVSDLSTVMKETTEADRSEKTLADEKTFAEENPFAEGYQEKKTFAEEMIFMVDEEMGYGITVVVHQARAEKCPRCWRFHKKEGEELCGRCDSVVKEEGHSMITEESGSVIKEESGSVIKEESGSVIKEESGSVIEEESESAIKGGLFSRVNGSLKNKYNILVRYFR